MRSSDKFLAVIQNPPFETIRCPITEALRQIAEAPAGIIFFKDILIF